MAELDQMNASSKKKQVRIGLYREIEKKKNIFFKCNSLRFQLSDFDLKT
jgi:hypothetical protein